MLNDYQGLYEKIEAIIELESEIRKMPRLEFGDKKVGEFNNLISSLPILSPNDLIEYQKFILKEILPDEKIKGKKEVVDYIEEKLDKVREICSNSAYSMIERVLKE